MDWDSWEVVSQDGLGIGVDFNELGGCDFSDSGSCEGESATSTEEVEMSEHSLVSTGLAACTISHLPDIWSHILNKTKGKVEPKLSFSCATVAGFANDEFLNSLVFRARVVVVLPVGKNHVVRHHL